MTTSEMEATLAKVQQTMIDFLDALQLARARISILEAENALLREAATLATKAEGERIYKEFERRWPAARRGA